MLWLGSIVAHIFAPCAFFGNRASCFQKPPAVSPLDASRHQLTAVVLHINKTEAGMPVPAPRREMAQALSTHLRLVSHEPRDHQRQSARPSCRLVAWEASLHTRHDLQEHHTTQPCLKHALFNRVKTFAVLETSKAQTAGEPYKVCV